jgi:hypothetical protein
MAVMSSNQLGLFAAIADPRRATLNHVDTASLAGGVYFHRLDYVSTTGAEFEWLCSSGKHAARV